MESQRNVKRRSNGDDRMKLMHRKTKRYDAIGNGRVRFARIYVVCARFHHVRDGQECDVSSMELSASRFKIDQSFSLQQEHTSRGVFSAAISVKPTISLK